MKTRIVINLFLGLAGMLALAPVVFTLRAASADVNWETLAQRLVSQNAGVKTDDIVQIAGGVKDIELLENIAVQVRKLGAFPFVRIYSDRMDKRMIVDVPEKYDAQSPLADLKLAAVMNVLIAVDHRLTEDLYGGIDPKRLNAFYKAGNAIYGELVKRNVRQVYLANGLYPTPWLAKRFGLTEAAMKKLFWDGVNFDYSVVQQKGETVRQILSAGSELHITNPNGTDFKVSIKGRPVSVSDGIISPEDARKGGQAAVVWLPAGEVLLTPVPGTAEGKLVHTLAYYEGKEIQNLTVVLSGGKAVSITGSGPGYAAYKAQYDAAESGKETFSVLDFGINPNIKMPAGAKIGNYVSAGTITVGIGGNNTAFGGNVNTSFGFDYFLPGSTITLDGKTIVDRGQLKIQ